MTFRPLFYVEAIAHPTLKSLDSPDPLKSGYSQNVTLANTLKNFRKHR